MRHHRRRAVRTVCASQVVVSLAGNVTFGTNVSMLCPTGANFVDSYAGLYGESGSYVPPPSL